MLKVRVLTLVHRDLERAQRWYRRIDPRLAADLEAEFCRALDQIASTGASVSEDALGLRHLRLRRFDDYALFFRVRGDTASVRVMFHASRDPKRLDTMLRHRTSP